MFLTQATSVDLITVEHRHDASVLVECNGNSYWLITFLFMLLLCAADVRSDCTPPPPYHLWVVPGLLYSLTISCLYLYSSVYSVSLILLTTFLIFGLPTIVTSNPIP
jgi:hypothetical protein